MAGDDRTEAATPRRLQRARDEGHVAISREVPALAGLGAASLIVAVAGPAYGGVVVGRLATMLAMTPETSVSSALMACCTIAMAVAGPVALGVAAASVAASLLQTGFTLNPGSLRPDLSRLSPGRGLKRIFGIAGVVESAKSVVKLGVFGFAIYHVAAGVVSDLKGVVYLLPGQLSDRIVAIVLRFAMTMLGAQVVIAAADTVWVRYQHVKQLLMTKEEVRQDARDADGNPQIKQRLRQIRLARSRKRMLAAVPGATVVVTNPTHYAIALAYDRNKGGAPRVVAKGVDDVAARIRDVARDNGVPLVANPPLARALYTVELDAEIPAEQFKVVAEIIAYVWRLRGKAVRP